MNKWIELFIGLILLVVAIYFWGMNLFSFGDAAILFLKGGIIWGVLAIGLLLVILGISDLKE